MQKVCKYWVDNVKNRQFFNITQVCVGQRKFALEVCVGGVGMGFLGALGWVLFSFALGFFIGLIMGASARVKKDKSDSDRKVAEK